MRHVALVVHNVRSAHNVGSILRTADGLGVDMVYLTGYTPYPMENNDQRLPHVSRKVASNIHKTALGAETSQSWEHHDRIEAVLESLRNDGYQLFALEQHLDSIALPSWSPPIRVAIIVGREVEGIEDDVIAMCDGCVQIPMLGAKESFNVTQAAAMALYHCRHTQH